MQLLGATPRWFGAITNTWFSMARARSSGSQWSLPVAAVKADGSTTVFAPRRQVDAEQLGEPQVVTGGHPDAERSGVRDDDLVPRGDRRGFAVHRTRDVDVEQVDLAVGPDDRPGRIDQARRVVQLLVVPGCALDDAAGEQR